MAGRQISPGNAHPPSRLCPPHLRPRFPCSYWTLKIFAFSSSAGASYAVSVRRASVLPAASFRFGLATDTLAVRLTVPAAGPVEDSATPCRATSKWVRPAGRTNEEGRGPAPCPSLRLPPRRSSRSPASLYPPGGRKTTASRPKKKSTASRPSQPKVSEMPNGPRKGTGHWVAFSIEATRNVPSRTH